MTELYVLQSDGNRVGPVTDMVVAQAIAAGSLPRDVLVAVPGATEWLHASRMPEVLAALESIVRASTRPPASSTIEIKPVVVEAKPEAKPEAKVEAKVEAPKPAPWPSWLSFAVFGAFALVAAAEIGIIMIRAR
jgi:hypothetical protein